MNMKDYFCLSRHLLPAIAVIFFHTKHSKTGNVYIFVIANIQSFTSQIFGIVGPLGEKNLTFFSPLGFDVQETSDDKTQKIKLYSVRALKCYLNETDRATDRATDRLTDRATD